MSIAILACSPTLPIQDSPESVSTILPEITETQSPTPEESQAPTDNPPATLTRTLEPTHTDRPPSTATNSSPTETNTPRPSATPTFAPVELLQGSFYGVDENHLGKGKATIIQTQIEEYTLHLENFEVTNGPGLHVILAEDNNPYNLATLGDYLDLGELQSTSGDQIYTLPDNVNLEKYGSVVIFCVPFEAIFAIAPTR